MPGNENIWLVLVNDALRKVARDIEKIVQRRLESAALLSSCRPRPFHSHNKSQIEPPDDFELPFPMEWARSHLLNDWSGSIPLTPATRLVKLRS